MLSLRTGRTVVPQPPRHAVGSRSRLLLSGVSIKAQTTMFALHPDRSVPTCHRCRGTMTLDALVPKTSGRREVCRYRCERCAYVEQWLWRRKEPKDFQRLLSLISPITQSLGFRTVR
jgi:hypothetical protein